jgi:hypothetical protein
MTPRSPTRMLAGHCDRYVVTAASPAGTISESPSVLPKLGCRAHSTKVRATHEMPRDGPIGACDVRFENPLYPPPH